MNAISRRAFLKTAATVAAAAAVTVPAIADGHAETHIVEIKGHKFSPASLTIKAGDSVEFVNLDGAPHTATADDGSFGTARLRKDEKETVQFASAGSFSYFCAVHPAMKGEIIVT